MPKAIRQLTQEQIKQLDKLWFIYGNYGPKHHDGGHRFIQVLLEHNEDARDWYGPSDECIDAVDAILAQIAGE